MTNKFNFSHFRDTCTELGVDWVTQTQRAKEEVREMWGLGDNAHSNLRLADVSQRLGIRWVDYAAEPTQTPRRR